MYKYELTLKRNVPVKSVHELQQYYQAQGEDFAMGYLVNLANPGLASWTGQLDLFFTAHYVVQTVFGEQHATDKLYVYTENWIRLELLQNLLVDLSSTIFQFPLSTDDIGCIEYVQCFTTRGHHHELKCSIESSGFTVVPLIETYTDEQCRLQATVGQDYQYPNEF